jgi:RHS repeat-associated protein
MPTSNLAMLRTSRHPLFVTLYLIALTAMATLLSPAIAPASSSLEAQRSACYTASPACAISVGTTPGIHMPSILSTGVPTISIGFGAHDDVALNIASLTISGTAGIGVSETHVISQTGTDMSGTISVTNLQAGSNTVSASICNTAGHCSAVAAATVVYTAPPTPVAHASPLIDLSPFNGTNWSRTKCGALCGDIAVSYSTPAYVSMDMAHSVRLAYSSRAAQAYETIQLSVNDNSAVDPNQISLRLQRQNGTWATFDSAGATAAVFQAGSSNRLAGRIPTLTGDISAERLMAVVTNYWTDGTAPMSTATPVHVLHAGAAASPYGAGWSVTGIPRLTVYRSNVDSGYVMSDGDAGAEIFLYDTCTDTDHCRFISPAGEFASLRTSYGGADTSRVLFLTARDSGVIAFDRVGRVRSVSDRFGNQVTIAWMDVERVASISDAIGKVTQFAYDGNGKLTAITDPAGRVTHFSVNALGDLAVITDAAGHASFRANYVAHVIQQSWDVANNQTDYAIDHSGNLARLTLPAIMTSAGALRSAIVVRSQDAVVLPVVVGTSALPAAATAVDSIKTTITNPQGGVTTFVINRFGEPLQTTITDAAATTLRTSATFDTLGRVLLRVSSTKHALGYQWDGERLARVDDFGTGEWTSHLRDVWGQDSVVSANGLVQSRLWSNHAQHGAIDSVTSAGGVVRYTYDSRGRRLTRVDEGGQRDSLTYEPTGSQNVQTITTSGPNSPLRTVSTGYDAAGRPIARTNPLNVTERFSYDALNRDSVQTRPGGATLQYAYDDVNMTASFTDALSQTFTETVDARGAITRQSDPRGGVSLRTYDAGGNMLSATDRRGRVVTYTYDRLNRVTSRTADGAATAFQYDSNGLWESVSNGESVDTVYRASNGRVVSEVSVRDAGAKKYAIESKFLSDESAERYSASAVGPWGRSSALGVSYDPAYGQPTSIAVGSSVGGMHYTAALLPDTLTLPQTDGPMAVTYTYGGDQTWNGVSYAGGGAQTAFGRSYSTDVIGRPDTIQAGDANVTTLASDGRRRILEFDSLGRVRSYADTHFYLTRSGTLVCPNPKDRTSCYFPNVYHATPTAQQVYTYDVAGNRTDSGAVVEPGNRLTSFNGFSLTYDEDGNLIRKEKPGVTVETFDWNALGELVSVTRDGQVTTFGYDGWGRRVRKTGPAGQTRYLWDGQNVFADLDSTGTTIRRQYFYFPGLDHPYAVVTGGATYYYALERPNHVAGLIDQTGHAVNKYVYGPFGEQISVQEQVAQPLRYGSREFDSETGLYYNRARYYDPQVGRFISEDPTGLAGGPNRYLLGGDDPVDFTDPAGAECRAFQVPMIERTVWSDGSITFRDILVPAVRCTGGHGGGGTGTRMKLDDTSPPCPTGGLGNFGFGLGYAGQLDAGTPAGGVAGTMSVSAGYFHNQNKGLLHGYSAAALLTGGVTNIRNGGPGGASYPSNQTPAAAVTGAFAGVAPFAFITNAASGRQLQGPFTTATANVGLGVADVGVQFSWGNGIWELSLSLPGGGGGGAGGSILTTNTKALFSSAGSCK